jgi:hypothetical protein
VALAGDRLHEHEREVGDGRVRDPHLRPVEHVVAAVAHRGRLDAGHVGPGARLGDRVASDDPAADEIVHPPALLLLRAPVDDRAGDRGALDVEARREDRRRPADLLDDQRVAHQAGRGASEGFRDDGAEEPELAHARHHLSRETPLALPPVDLGLELAPRERARHRLDFSLFRGQPEAQRHPPVNRGSRFSKCARSPSW